MSEFIAYSNDAGTEAAFIDPDSAARWVKEQAHGTGRYAYAFWVQDRSSSGGTDLVWEIRTWHGPGTSEVVVGSVHSTADADADADAEVPA